MDLNWMISVDDHIIEPPNVWQDRVPAKLRDAAPRIVRDDQGEAWVYENKRIPTPGLSAVVGKEREEFSPLPVTYDEMRPGCYDSVARLEDMDRGGVLASLCFPSFPRFCGQIFYEADDHDLALTCVEAYNDWMIDEWCGAAPGRYIPLIIIPLWDPPAAAREIERCAAKGAKAVAFSENPSTLGLPSIHDEKGYWDPMFAAAADAGLPICMHVGSSSNIPKMSADSPLIVSLAWGSGCLTSGTMCDWIFSQNFTKFPDLKIVLSEGGIGWIPYFIERAEQVYDKQRFWAAKSNFKWDLKTGAISAEAGGAGDLELNIREIFRRHIFGCFIEDNHGIANLGTIGVDNIMIETDYPHSDSTWPNCLEVAHKSLAGLSDGDKWKVMQGNARRVFNFEPAPRT